MEVIGEWERKLLVQELSAGQEAAKELLSNAENSVAKEAKVQKILASISNALSLLRQTDANDDSPDSGCRSPLSDDSGKSCARPSKDQDRREISKKRKMLPQWTERIGISSDSWCEGSLGDRYTWRKYGQKDILGAKYPRGYYRCTHRNSQGCPATKQVQRSDDDHSIFDITYRGKHTCIYSTHRNPTNSPKSQPENVLDFKAGGLNIKTEAPENAEMIGSCPSFSFPCTPTVDSKGIFSPATSAPENQFSGGGFSPAFVSPTTSESNYFAGLGEILSAPNSSTNSPMMDMDLMLHNVEFDPEFPFDPSEFF
ncbi:hypothetical protein AMTRI_Chr01g130640 [Amborella trichopoda]|uniref:probable WRKY transcription factor 53 n=1 Tax=Amborella trichopoda TaxID=13333 RepID=UPI0005D39BC2|nr:probable WRKY transcription factor 53 [Amborella trichopoda]|eukprot:XP_011624454.1 probable WRKY transcription factor 53 [Amborella trichopoda]